MAAWASLGGSSRGLRSAHCRDCEVMPAVSRSLYGKSTFAAQVWRDAPAFWSYHLEFTWSGASEAGAHMSSEPTNAIHGCANFPRLVWVVPAILLIGATSELPDGYNTFTRMITCGVAAVIA